MSAAEDVSDSDTEGSVDDQGEDEGIADLLKGLDTIREAASIAMLADSSSDDDDAGLFIDLPVPSRAPGVIRARAAGACISSQELREEEAEEEADGAGHRAVASVPQEQVEVAGAAPRPQQQQHAVPDLDLRERAIAARHRLTDRQQQRAGNFTARGPTNPKPATRPAASAIRPATARSAHAPLQRRVIPPQPRQHHHGAARAVMTGPAEAQDRERGVRWVIEVDPRISEASIPILAPTPEQHINRLAELPAQTFVSRSLVLLDCECLVSVMSVCREWRRLGCVESLWRHLYLNKHEWVHPSALESGTSPYTSLHLATSPCICPVS